MSRDKTSRRRKMAEQTDETDSLPDFVRRKYGYRRMAMRDGTKLPARLAMKLVGPDCAYHLYAKHTPTKNENQEEPI